MAVTTKKAVESAITSLRRLSNKATREGLARFAIHSDNAFGVSTPDIRNLAKKLGRNHELAIALWETGLHDARCLACFVDDPAEVTPAQMDRWAKDFDNWAVCDAACFHLFDRTPHAFRKVKQWSTRKEEFVKRAAFALLASIALHDKKAGDEPFIESLELIERAATDPRNFVKKAVNWALRGIGKRNLNLHPLAVELSQKLAESGVSAARWVGMDALRELTSPAVVKRLQARK
jgi:3-methyladenine DNA glycosylase AlkD